MASEISGLGQLPAASRLTAYDKKIQTRATLKDVYVNHTGLFSRNDQSIPDGIYTTVDQMSNSSANKINITMKLPLTGSVVTGNDRLLGNEVSPSTKSGTLYRNNYKYAVRTETYNTRKLDQDYIGLYDMHVKDLGVHAAQFEGKQIRQAILKRYPNDMIAGDLLGDISQAWNPHVYVQGATDINQPDYDSTNQDNINNIVTAIESVSGSFIQNQAGAANFRMINRIALRALDKKIMPLTLEGNDAYVLTVSPLSATMYTDPTLSASAGGVWTDANRLSEKVQNWYGILGKFKTTIGVDIYITVDPKCPTVMPGGSAAPFTLTPGFMDEGDVDNRNYSSGNTRDCGILHGKGTLVKWEPEKLHMVSHMDDYDRIKGTGYAGTRGIQMLVFDSPTATDTSFEYYGSMLCIMNRWPGYATA